LQGSGDNGERDNNGGSSSGSDEVYKESVELVLVSLSNLYLLLESISVSTIEPSSYPTSHHLLTTSTTDYYLKKTVNNFGLKRLFYSKQDHKDTCCSPV